MQVKPKSNHPIPSHMISNRVDSNIDNIQLVENVDKIEFPSDYLFYDTKSIKIRDLKFRELARLTAATQSGSLENIVESLAPCVLDFDIVNLTYGDFIGLMYTLRMDMSIELQISYSCTSKKHQQMIHECKDSEELEGIEKAIVQNCVVKSSDIDFVKPKDLSKFKIDQQYKIAGLQVRPNLVIDTIQIDKLVRLSDADDQKAKEIIIKYRYASLLDNQYGNTLEEKSTFLSDWFDSQEDYLKIVEQFQDFEILSTHGISNSINLNCEVCSEKSLVQINFDPTDFFPAL